MLEASCRSTILDGEEGAYGAGLIKGDIWYVPKGRPHSIQGIGEGGCEFMLIFNDGNFSEDKTFLLSNRSAHTLKEVVAKNTSLDPSGFDKLSHKGNE